MATRTWADLSDGQRAAVIVAGSLQLSLAATAWADLACRSAAQVRGRKPVWTAVIAVSWVGPLAYFARGRRRS